VTGSVTDTSSEGMSVAAASLIGRGLAAEQMCTMHSLVDGARVDAPDACIDVHATVVK